jgi:hypothetical protein
MKEQVEQKEWEQPEVIDLDVDKTAVSKFPGGLETSSVRPAAS